MASNDLTYTNSKRYLELVCIFKICNCKVRLYFRRGNTPVRNGLEALLWYECSSSSRKLDSISNCILEHYSKRLLHTDLTALCMKKKQVDPMEVLDIRFISSSVWRICMYLIIFSELYVFEQWCIASTYQPFYAIFYAYFPNTRWKLSQ